MQNDGNSRTSSFFVLHSHFCILKSALPLRYLGDGLQAKARGLVAAKRYGNPSRSRQIVCAGRLHKILRRCVPGDRPHNGDDCGGLVDRAGWTNLPA